MRRKYLKITHLIKDFYSKDNKFSYSRIRKPPNDIISKLFELHQRRNIDVRWLSGELQLKTAKQPYRPARSLERCEAAGSHPGRRGISQGATHTPTREAATRLLDGYPGETKTCVYEESYRGMFVTALFTADKNSSNQNGCQQANMANPCVLATQSSLTLCDLVDCSSPGSSIHGILQARTLEWVAISFSRGSSQPRNPTQVSCVDRQTLYGLNNQGGPINTVSLCKREVGGSFLNLMRTVTRTELAASVPLSETRNRLLLLLCPTLPWSLDRCGELREENL